MPRRRKLYGIENRLAPGYDYGPPPAEWYRDWRRYWTREERDRVLAELQRLDDPHFEWRAYDLEQP